MKKLAEEIIRGRRLSQQDDLSVFEYAKLGELAEGADRIRESLCGRNVDLCTIINGRSGRCSEDCRFCAQSAFHQTGCEKYEMLDEETILRDCKAREAAGVQAYSIVTAGRAVEGEELERLVRIYERLRRECKIRLCASHGFLGAEALRRLKGAGVERYHANIETSERNFPSICTTHSYRDKLRVIQMAREAGLEVCSGGIIGLGELWQDRVDMAAALAGQGVYSIPINVLMPFKGTPLGSQVPLEEDEIIRTVAMFRYLNPAAYIRIAAGRAYFRDGGRRLFRSGVNAAITGDMLTTTGTNTAQDMKMLAEMGFRAGGRPAKPGQEVRMQNE